MSDIVERLAKCGVPELTAKCIVQDFKRRNKVGSLVPYLWLMEREHHVAAVEGEAPCGGD